MTKGKRQHDNALTCFIADSVSLYLSLIVGAYLMSVAVVYPHYPWLSWITLFPLFVAIRVSKPLRAILCGATWGMSLIVFLVAQTNTPIPVTPFSFCLLILIPSLYALLGSRLTRWIGYNPFILAVGWIVVEFAFTPLGIRYGLLATAQTDGWLLNVVGQTFGYTFVAFIAAYFCAYLVTTINKICLRSPCRRNPGQGNNKRAIKLIQELVYNSLSTTCNNHSRAPPQSPFRL